MSLIHKITCVLTLSFLFVLAASAQTNIIKHTVQQGETLYALSQKYAVTVELIMQSNQGLTAENLKAGQVVLIPVSKMAGADCREMHKVRKGETVWGIAQKYGVKVEELVKANPAMQAEGFKLKKGKFVCIPYPAEAPVEVVVPEAGAASVVAGNSAPENQKPATAGDALDCVNVALLLPFASTGPEGVRCVEYYRGFLMAVEELKKQGKNVNIIALNEPANADSITSEAEKIVRHNTHLLFGPLHTSHVSKMAGLASKYGFKMLAPFSSKVKEVETNSNIYLTNSPEELKHRVAADMFVQKFKRANVIILNTKKANEKSFTTLLDARLKASGGSVVSLDEACTDEELLAVLSLTSPNFFIPDANDKNTYQKLLSRMKQIRTNYPEYRTSLFGYPDWQAYTEKFGAEAYDADVYFFTNFFYDANSIATRNFNTDYQRWFKVEQLHIYPRMAMLGYDAGTHMMKALLKHGTTFAAQPIECEALQSPHIFAPVENGKGGYINNSMMLIHLRPDGITEKMDCR